MPTTLEAGCEKADCELDMPVLNYTYDVPNDVTVGDFSCPSCDLTDSPRAIEF